MNQRTAQLAASFSLALGLAACSGTIEDTPTQTRASGLSLDAVTEHQVSGTFVDPDRTVAFDAAMVSEQVVVVRFGIDSRSFEFDIDFGAGLGDFDSGLAALEADDLEALAALARALELAFPGDHTERGMLVQTLVQQTAYLASAPVDVALPGMDIVGARSITCLSTCSCTNQYIGNGYWRTAGKGSGCTGGSGNGCKGRCGVGCGSNGGGYYTHDCARHDYGLAWWTTASDDYSFGWDCSC